MSSSPDFLSVDGQRLEYQWHGPPPHDAPALVFLHEGLGCVALWRDLPAELAAATGCGALLYSRAGYGHSDPCALPRPTTYLHHEALEVLPQVLAALEVRDHVLVGHSDGGSIALVYAGGTPAPGLRGVVTEAAHVFNEEVTVQSIRVVREQYVQGDLRTRLAKYHDHVDAAFWGWNDTWLSDEFRVWNLEAFLPDIRVPLLALQGEDDQYGTPAQLHAIAAQTGGPCAARLLPGCAHTPHFEQRDEVLTAVQTFVERVLE
ncbi:alpha/beta hydrolase [soil metagenome]